MRAPSRSRWFAVLLLLAGAAGCAARGGGDGRSGWAAARRGAIEREERRCDEPDAAEAYYRSRRQPMAPGIEPMAAYERARARLAVMPAYSSRLGAPLERRSGAEALGSARAEAASLTTWEPLGPGNVGGRTRVLLIDPSDWNVMYAAGVSGGVWKTTDGGASWRPLCDALANIATNSLAMDPNDPRVLYAGTGEGYFREVVRGTGLPLRGAGIFKTADGGESWVQLAATRGEDFFWVNDVVISRHDSRRLYCATRTGVWRSDDAGESWSRVLDPRVNGGCLDLAERTDRATDYLFASCGSFEQASVYRNEDAASGAPWAQVLTETAMGRTSLAVAPSNQNVVYALAASNVPGPRGEFEQGLHAVFRSTSSGAPGSWQARVRNTASDPVNYLLLTNPVVAVAHQCDPREGNEFVTMGWYVNVIAVDPRNSDRVWAAGVDLFRSDDGGRRWGPASYWWTWESTPSFVHADQHGITFHPGYDGDGNQTMLVVNDGGVFRTDNANAAVGSGTFSLCNPAASQVRWVSLNHGLGVTQFYHGLPFPGGHSYIGGTQDNGTQRGDDGAGPDGWQAVFGGDGGYVAIDPSDVRTLFVETQRFQLQRSRDGGRSFELAISGITDGPGSFLFIAPFVMDPGEPRRLWAGGRRLWRSEDRAQWWTAASRPVADGGMVSALAVAPGLPSRVVAGTDRGSILRNDSALAAGPSSIWQAASPRPGFVTSLAFDPGEASRVYATYGGFGGTHVWRSEDGGESWSGLDGTGDGALPDIPAHCLLADPGRSGRLFLATDLGVLVSPNGGASWAVESTGFASVVTESLALTRSSDGKVLLFAFTHGRGAWRVELDEGVGSATRPPRRRLPRTS